MKTKKVLYVWIATVAVAILLLVAMPKGVAKIVDGNTVVVYYQSRMVVRGGIRLVEKNGVGNLVAYGAHPIGLTCRPATEEERSLFYSVLPFFPDL